MAVWFQIALVLNVIYWIVFFYLLSRRRWNFAALAVGIFHMLFAAVGSVAPIRSLLDPDYPGYGLGLFHFEKLAVVIPAALVLGWALAAAWIVVGKGTGPWMRLVMLGDLFFALNLGISLLVENSQDWKFELGENFSVSGIPGLMILLGLFTLPFLASAFWAANRIKDGTSPPVASMPEVKPEASSRDHTNTNGFRYSESRV